MGWQDDPERRRELLRGFVLVTIFDVVVVGGVSSTWMIAGLVELPLALVSACVRVLLWAALLWVSLEPLRRFEAQGPGASDAELRAAADRQQRVLRTLPWVYSLLGAVMQLVWIARGELGSPVLYGYAERLSAWFMWVSALPIAALVYLILAYAIRPTSARLARAVDARGLSTSRPRTSITTPLTNVAMALIIGGLLSTVAGIMMWNASQRRELVEAELRQRVELGSAHLRLGESLGDGVALVGFDELPAPLRGRSASGEWDRGMIASIHEPELGQMYAATEVGEQGWIVATTELDADLRMLVWLIVAMLGIACPMFWIGFRIFARSLREPLEQVTDAAGEFVERGDLHALEHLASLTDDEVSRLADRFRDIFALLDELSEAAHAVSEGDLRVELDHPGPLHDAFRGMLGRLNEIVARLRATALELASAAAELTTLTEHQDRASQVQSSEVQRLTASVASLTTAAQQIAEDAEAVQRDADQARATTDSTTAAIASLRDEANGVSEILQLIDEIARRSDLLALNGSLEATRAGEAGRGFALVAQEMRRLAERTTSAVSDIRTRVEGIEAAGTRAVLATARSNALVERTAAAAGRISTATAAQSSETLDASAGLDTVAAQLSATTVAMSQTRASAESLRESAVALERLIDAFELREGSRPETSPTEGRA